MNAVFSILLCVSAAVLIVRGDGDALLASLTAGAGDAVSACLSMSAAYLVWMGLLNVMRQAGLMRMLSRLLRPVLHASCLELFPASLVALRQSCGSLRPTAVVLPTLLSSLLASAAAVVLCLVCIRSCRSRSSSCC